MPATRKYQINENGRYICPNCDKTFKSQYSCSNHFNKTHKTAPPTITITNTQPISEVMPVKLVSRKEFDELKAQYQTIIDMLTAIATANKPIIQTCEISTQTEEEVIVTVEQVEEVVEEVEVVPEVEVVEEVVDVVQPVEEAVVEVVEVVQPVEEPLYDISQDQPCDKVEVVEHVKVDAPIDKQPKKQPKKTTKKPTIEEEYEKARNMLLNHPYRVDDGFKSPVNGEVYNKAIDLIKHIELWQDKDGKMLKPIERRNVLKDYTTFQSAYDTYKNAKAKYDKKQKQKQKQEQEPIKKVDEPIAQKVEEQAKKVVKEVVKKVEKEAKKIVEEIEDKNNDTMIDIADPKHKEFLLDCCMNCTNGGLAKAYHYLNDHKKWHIIKHEQVQTYKEEVVRTVFETVMAKDIDENGEEYEYETQRPVLDKKGNPKQEKKLETIEHKFRTFKAFNATPPQVPCLDMCKDCKTCDCKSNTCKLCKQCPNCKELKEDYKQDMIVYQRELKEYKENGYAPIKFTSIRDKIKETYDTMCAVWWYHRRADYDVFDHRVEWDKVSVDLVNDDTIDQFFFKSDVKYEETN